MAFAELKDKQRLLRDDFPSDLGLRVHRSLSWLNRAELSGDDVDAQFIFLWISFNAAYATDIEIQNRSSEANCFESFFQAVLESDKDERLYELVWSEFANTIRVLLDNQFIFQPFWDYHNGRISKDDWEARFSASKKRVAKGLGQKDTGKVLSVVFRRLYTLRNQIIHGGATWNSSANRSQLRDCSNILMKVMPVVIDLMMENPSVEWGDAFYPLIKQ